MSSSFTYEVVKQWEQLPSGWEHGDVADVAIDSTGRVYVFNRGDHPVIVYGDTGEFLLSWGEDQFVWPHGMTIGPDGSIFCIDAGAHAVYQYTPDGELMMTLGTPGTPCDNGYVPGDSRSVARGGPPFNRPTALTVGPDGDLYVSDGYGNARVHRFSPNGQLKSSWGEPGTGPGQFHLPHAIQVTADEQLLVADRENSRIQRFDLDGGYVGEWTDTCRPDGLAVDGEGNVYVCDLGLRAARPSSLPSPSEHEPHSLVSVFSPSGDLLSRWGTGNPCAAGSFFAAHGIAVDSHGDVYVTEVNHSAGGNAGMIPSDCHTFQKFSRVT